MGKKVICEGFAFDSQTRDWTHRIEYEARNYMEAIRWMNMNADWFKHLRIIRNDFI